MPDRTEANPNELNQDDARYGFRCCHLKNIWTAPLPPETELSRQMTTFFFQADDGIRHRDVTGVQTCALPISEWSAGASRVTGLPALRLAGWKTCAPRGPGGPLSDRPVGSDRRHPDVEAI